MIFIVISSTFLWSYHFSICFSFNHYIPSLSLIVFVQFLSYIFLLISTIFVRYIPQKFQDFLIFSFISLYSLNTLFTETNLSWLIYELIKALEIRTFIVFNLSFPIKTILSCFFFFFIIDSYVLIHAVIAQSFIPTADLTIPTGTQTN